MKTPNDISLPVIAVDHIEAITSLEPCYASFVESIQAMMNYDEYTKYCTFRKVEPVSEQQYHASRTEYHAA